MNSDDNYKIKIEEREFFGRKCITRDRIDPMGILAWRDLIFKDTQPERYRDAKQELKN